jgi:diphthine synthase
VLANRKMVENGEKIIKEALKNDVALLIVGSPLMATTHVSLILEANKAGVLVKVINNASVFDAVGITGLQLYKFGQIASIPFYEEFIELETPYNILKENVKIGLHTLFLLDLNPDLGRFMTVNDALEILEKMEKRKNGKIVSGDILVVGCARLGRNDFIVKKGSLKEIKGFDFGKPPHCLIIPGKMHFIEEEMLETFNLTYNN